MVHKYMPLSDDPYDFKRNDIYVSMNNQMVFMAQYCSGIGQWNMADKPLQLPLRYTHRSYTFIHDIILCRIYDIQELTTHTKLSHLTYMYYCTYYCVFNVI